MIRALYSSATGMKAQELLLDVTANNLANVNTNGFKRSHVDFADLVYTNVRTAGVQTADATTPIGLQIGSGARATGTTKLFTPGTTEQTFNETDLAIEGPGFFKVTVNGQDRYTRDGAFHPDATGQLVTADGFPLADAINIPPDAEQISINTDGAVSVRVGDTVTPVGQIQLYSFSNPAGLSNEGNNLFALTPASGPEQVNQPGQDGAGSIRQGVSGTVECSSSDGVGLSDYGTACLRSQCAGHSGR